MAVTGLDHVYVETRDFDRARAFWEGLGFALAESWGAEGHRAGRLVSGDAAVVLAECPARGSAQGATVHFAASDLEAMDARLSDLDVAQVITPLEDTHWGTRWIRIRDADGNLYCLEAPR